MPQTGFTYRVVDPAEQEKVLDGGRGRRRVRGTAQDRVERRRGEEAGRQ
ncbi:MAG: hypothetical protein R2710_02240 [Acidimicrobiales bacterium]